MCHLDGFMRAWYLERMSEEQLKSDSGLERLKKLPGSECMQIEGFKNAYRIKVVDTGAWDREALPHLSAIFGPMIYDAYAPDELKPLDPKNEAHRNELQSQCEISFVGASEVYVRTNASQKPIGFLPIEYFHGDQATAVFRDIVVNKIDRINVTAAYSLLRMLYADTQKKNVLAYTKDPRLILLAYTFGTAGTRPRGSELTVSVGESTPTGDSDIDTAIAHTREDLRDKDSLASLPDVPGYVYLRGDKHILPPNISEYSGYLAPILPVIGKMDELQQEEIDRATAAGEEPHAVATIVVAVRKKI